MKKIILLLCASVFVLTGCGTIAGAGKDIEKGGRAIEKTADKVAEKMSK